MTTLSNTTSEMELLIRTIGQKLEGLCNRIVLDHASSKTELVAALRRMKQLHERQLELLEGSHER